MQNLSVTLNLESISQVVSTIIKESSTQIRIGLHISENIDLKTLPAYKNKLIFELQYSNLSEIIVDSNAKNNFNNWLVNRGFEELVKAINAGLNIANLLIELSNDNGKVFNKKLDLDSYVKSKSEKISSKSIPDLITKLEQSTGKSLKLKDIILSINKARNILIHYNGRVVKKHCNQGDKLNLIWKKFFIFAIENGNEVEVKIGGSYTSAISLKTIDCSKIFKIGEKVEISVNEYEELLSTIGVILVAELTEITKEYV